MEKEVWKDIEGHKGYQVSNMGRARSLDRIVERYGKATNVKLKGKILKGSKDVNGYPTIWLSGNPNVVVHRLVAKAFIPNPDNLPEVNHINGIKADNRLENLEWVTREKNIQHAFKNGLKNGQKGSKNASSKLTEDDVRKIKELLASGMKQTDIARRYAVSRTVIYCIKTGKTWAHVS